ncbi:type I restriction enzyme HsdR N-terminal domain-containing protein [Desulfococcus multivorans]|uniref:Stress protein n=1 Tax=Desulfococcus multivorans DSM 2059 TaxID=1121405 RepID=S7T803_DESML|nr:type I restriction enzyme HsdR N-terminal domain-containing protein [Desulfococcus multivorans]AQU99751.1 hypothetical protein B2D07_02480 [Desulfococcus multivorans]EPR33252.1 stress protein [Desulfococcus multivorans DSM 2059]SKA21662.1 Type I restriction enzyme R protein N terminus (HSDR_N) [Desulfococcus multivorans DSM 2059]
MWTKCSNGECGFQFKVNENKFGQFINCKKCGNEFRATFSTDPPPTVNVIDEAEREKVPPDPKDTRKRTSPKEIMARQIDEIKQNIKEHIPMLDASLANKDNESDTRLILDRILQDVLNYRIEDIKTEQKIQGRKADYVLSVNGDDVMVIEAKRVTMGLSDKQIFQASSYGAYSGIRWALLTNAAVWQLYRISMSEKIETDLVFSIDLRDGLDEQEAQYFYLISKDGMSRKGLLENLWQRMSALCYENILTAIFTDGVISKIRATLTKDTGCRLTNDEVRDALEKRVFQIA